MSKQSRLSNHDWIKFDDNTQLYWACGREDALFVADIISILRGVDDMFIIGGEKMYDLFEELVNKIYLTEVFGDFVGDAFFRKKFDLRRKWKCLVEEDHSQKYSGDEVSHRFSIYERRDRRYRYKMLTSFYTDQLQKNEWLRDKMKSNSKAVDSYIQTHLEV